MGTGIADILHYQLLAWDEATAPSGIPTGYYTVTATMAHKD